MTRVEADRLLEEVARTQNRLRGRLCQLVESWGMDAKREAAMIGTIKTTSYDNERELKKLLHSLALEGGDHVAAG